MTVDAISLEVFKNLFASVPEEMGLVLQRAAFSPNIRERLDHSCAIFDHDARMVAQAAHIPVHLGSMPASVEHAIDAINHFQPGDVIYAQRSLSRRHTLAGYYNSFSHFYR